MVRLSIAVHAASTRAAHDLLDALRFVAVNAQLEPGCVRSSAWMGPDAVRYVEEWQTEADMRRRVRSDAFTPVLTIVESGVQNEVQFDFVTRTRGLDYVAEMRSGMVGD